MAIPVLAVIDNDAWALQTITQWLKAQPRQCTLAWATTSCAQAVHGCLYAKPDVDVLLVDMALGAMSGPNLCKTIRMHSPRPAVLGMTAFDPELFRDDLAAAGAQGIMDKQSIIPGLTSWLATLAEGGSIQPESFHDARTAHRILCASPQTPAAKDIRDNELSTREREVLALYAQGKTTDEVAGVMAVSRNTVYTFIDRASGKLGVRNRAEAIEKARWYGLL
ncbi:helix-turn-helix transcriptional regulator [Bifidobacterium sp. AGR2158]|uniref:helix-turn-helix transcriptional regulator n=1 Tax=Bifidobacterium sp. AGR2158 TaxID=1280675 RepID=UPI000401AE2C|nr:response regulator transcription factor [Bifidobacterium sp. AGR2158]